MNGESPPSSAPARRPRAALILIIGTLAICAAALWFRTPLRARYWAWRLIYARQPAERVAHLNLLLSAGEESRWGVEALLRHADAEIRQYGVVSLHHIVTPWARGRLLERLADTDETVRELAALGLALHGDPAVVPVLKQMYAGGDRRAADAACVALERLGTTEAVAALAELAEQPADAERRALLIDALEAIGTANAERRPACARPLLPLLADHRACDWPARPERLARQALQHMPLEKLSPQAAALALSPASAPAEEVPPRTVAERAARALARLTGLHPPFFSAMPPEERRAAERQWNDWCANRVGGP